MSGPHVRLGGAARAAERLLVGAIRAYQLTLSPWIGRQCRYLPTCSEYAIDAIERRGVVRGSWLAVRRIARCHPWGGSGYDPVPSAATERGDGSRRAAP